MGGAGWGCRGGRPAPTRVHRRAGGRGGGVAGVKSVGGGCGGAVAGSVAMWLVPSASAHRAERVVAPQRCQQQPAQLRLKRPPAASVGVRGRARKTRPWRSRPGHRRN